jgi:hypothetical protein
MLGIKSINELSKMDDFHPLMFHSDVAVAFYAEVPVKSASGQSFTQSEAV